MKRGSERALEKLMRLFSSKMGKRELAEGVRGVFIPSLIKTSHWRKGIRILRTLSPDIPDRDPEIYRW
jgi:hypothetical protein